MRILPWVLCLVVAAAAEDLTTVDGKVYRNVTIRKVEPDGLSITHESGLAKVPFTKLSKEVQEKHGYDPVKGEAFAKEQAAKQAQAEEELTAAVKAAVTKAKRRELEHVARGELDEMKKRFAKRYFNVAATIRQITEDGFLADATAIQGEVGYIMVLGKPGVHVDGEVWTGRIWHAGTYRYTTTAGGSKTVHCYATTPETAFQYFVDQVRDE